jgi:polyketide biosynthesis acyl carrier protein
MNPGVDVVSREEILAIVIKNLRLNVEAVPQEVDASKSMALYGAGSLDVVEIVSASMRELRLRVPRTQLAGLKNINELVDLFTRMKNGAQSA